MIGNPKNLEELKKRLTSEQFHVTQNNGTEMPFKSNPLFIQMNITKPLLKESISVLSAISHYFLLTLNLIVDVDGLRFGIN